MDSRFEEELARFAAMESCIKDMDYYKAETEAARNGQIAAMELAEERQKIIKMCLLSVAENEADREELADNRDRWIAFSFILGVVIIVLLVIIYGMSR